MQRPAGRALRPWAPGRKLLDHRTAALTMRTLPSASVISEFRHIRLDTRSIKVLSFANPWELQQLITEWGANLPNFLPFFFRQQFSSIDPIDQAKISIAPSIGPSNQPRPLAQILGRDLADFTVQDASIRPNNTVKGSPPPDFQRSRQVSTPSPAMAPGKSSGVRSRNPRTADG